MQDYSALSYTSLYVCVREHKGLTAISESASEATLGSVQSGISETVGAFFFRYSAAVEQKNKVNLPRGISRLVQIPLTWLELPSN